MRGGQKSTTTIGLVNAQSVRNKTDILHDYILEQKIDLCCFDETWLRENDELLIKHLTSKGFAILHHDRKGKIGGSVAVLFKTAFKAKLNKFLVYTSFGNISGMCSLQTPFIDGISGGTFFDEIAELFQILAFDKKYHYYFVILTFTLTKMMIPM